MKLFIWTADPKKPDYSDLITGEVLQEVIPGSEIIYSRDFKTDDYRDDKNFTFVIPGGLLLYTIDGMIDSGASVRCQEATDDGHHFIGFCAGAYYGASEMLPGKTYADPFYTFEMSNRKLDRYRGPGLGMVDNLVSVGPFSPNGRQHTEPRKMNGEVVTLQDNLTNVSFTSLYMEGPLFLNRSFSDFYSDTSSTVGKFVCGQSKHLKLLYPNGERIYLDIANKTIPAVVHGNKKNSHRYLFSAHPELTCKASTFLTAYNREHEELCARIKDEDIQKLVDEQVSKANLDYLKRTLKFS